MSYPVTPGQAPPVQPKKKRRVFLWVFLAIQMIFLIWIIGGVATANSTPSHAEVLQACANGGWQGVFSSYSDCMVHYANGLMQASEAGTAIGAGIVIALWVAVDVILGIGYAIYRLARRP